MAATLFADAVPIAALFVLGVMVVFFVREGQPPELVAFCGAAALLALGALDGPTLLSAIANPAPVTIAAMFIVSAALVRTGVLDVVGGRLGRLARKQRAVALVSFFGTAAVASAFVNNTPVAMALIPLAVALGRQTGLAPAKLLMPLSFMVIMGGTCTLIGTSTNLLVDGVARSAGLPRFTMFEIAPLGLIVLVVGGLYLGLVGWRLIPDRGAAPDDVFDSSERRFLLELVVPADSPLIGRKVLEVTALEAGGGRVIDVVRGDASLRDTLPEIRLEAGDRIVLRTNDAEAVGLRSGRAGALPASLGAEPIGARDSVVYEVLVGPRSAIVGKTLRRLKWQRRYGVYPLALHREGADLEERLETIPIAIGDVLLIDGAPEDVQRLIEESRLTKLTPSSAQPFRREKAPIAIAAIVGVTVLSSLDVAPILTLAVIAAAIVLATGCVAPEEGFGAMDGRVLVLIVSMLAVGAALEKSGAMQIIVDGLAPILRAAPPLLALALIYAVTSILTETVTNNAVAVIMTPIAIGVAAALGLDPRPFVIVVMFGASASFATPIGYQTNTLVYTAGGYRFRDFLLVGGPLNIIVGAATVLAIPLFWPLAPVE